MYTLMVNNVKTIELFSCYQLENIKTIDKKITWEFLIYEEKQFYY